MNRTSIRLLAAIAGLLCIYQIGGFFFLSGADISGLSTVSPSACTAKIFVSSWEEPSVQTEYILDDDALLQVKNLLTNSTYIRFLRSGAPMPVADGTNLYMLCFYFDDPADFLTLRITGNEYISSTALAGGADVKIMNRGAWERAFAAILSE